MLDLYASSKTAPPDQFSLGSKVAESGRSLLVFRRDIARLFACENSIIFAVLLWFFWLGEKRRRHRDREDDDAGDWPIVVRAAKWSNSTESIDASLLNKAANKVRAVCSGGNCVRSTPICLAQMVKIDFVIIKKHWITVKIVCEHSQEICPPKSGKL